MFIESLLVYRIVDMDTVVKNQDLLATARSLTLSPRSGMNRALDAYQELVKERSLEAKAIFAYYKDLPVGWIIVTKEADGFSFQPVDGQACLQVFVKPDFRRHKIGTKLVQLARQIYPEDQINAYAHNNYDFFNPLISQGLCKNIYSI